MTEALVIWVFLTLVQQQGMVGGAGADQQACEAARANALEEMKALGSDVIAVSTCQPLTLEPVRK